MLLNNELAATPAIACLLSGVGSDVVRSTSVAEGLEQLHAHMFAAIVVDLRPDLMGYDAVRCLRAAGILLPLLFISARTTPDARQLPLAAGASAVSTLPFSHDQMRITLSLLFAPDLIEQEAALLASFQPVAPGEPVGSPPYPGLR
ncbi:MAG TPA: response regulator [Rhodopila sp.]|nr:response regulator [Rhodopila sp.]